MGLGGFLGELMGKPKLVTKQVSSEVHVKPVNELAAEMEARNPHVAEGLDPGFAAGGVTSGHTIGDLQELVSKGTKGK